MPEKLYFRVLKSPIIDQHTWHTGLSMPSFSSKMLCKMATVKFICMCFNICSAFCTHTIKKWNLIISLQNIQNFSIEWEFSMLCVQFSWFKEICGSTQITQTWKGIILNKIKYNLLQGLKADFHIRTRVGWKH